MKGLHAYHILNAAAFPIASCNVDGHFQYIGTNGAGKTTNMRIPLYFYNPSGNKRDHAIETSKDTFNSFYFRGEFSFIIFEVCRGLLANGKPDLYHVAVYRHRTIVPTFLFIDAPYDMELYRNKSGYLCNAVDLIQRLNSENIRSEPVKLYERFKEVIYGLNKSKEMAPFVFAQPRPHAISAMRTIPGILSSIFRAEAMKTGTLKEALIASLGIAEGEASVDLQSIVREFRKFHRYRKDILTFERNQQKLQSVLKRFHEVKEKEAHLSSLYYQIATQLPKAKDQLSICETEIRVLKAKAEHISKKALEELEVLSKVREVKLEDRSESKLKRDTAIKYKNDYPAETWSVILADIRRLPGLRDERKSIVTRLARLNEEYQSIEDKYGNLIREQRLNVAQKAQRVKSTSGEEVDELQKSINNLTEQSNAEKEKLELEFAQKRMELDTRVSKAIRTEGALHVRVSDLSLEMFLREDLEKAQVAYDSIRQEHTKIIADVETIPARKQNLDQQNTIIRSDIERRYHPQVEDTIRSIEGFDRQIERLRILVSKYEGSLLQFVENEVTQSTSRFLSVVREEVLFLPASEVIQEVTGSGNSMLGVTIIPESLPAPQRLHYQEQKDALEKLEKQKTDLVATKDELTTRQANELKEQEDSYLQQSAKLSSEEDELRVRLSNAAQRFEGAKSHVDGLLRKREEMFGATKEKLSRDLENASDELQASTEEKASFEGKIQTRKQKINSELRAQVDPKNIRINGIRKQAVADLKELEIELESQLDLLSKSKEQELKSGSADPNVTQQLNQKKDETDQLIERIEETLVKAQHYEEHILPEVQRIPEYEQAHERTSNAYNDAQRQYSERETKRDNDLNQTKTQLDEFESKLEIINQDIHSHSELRTFSEPSKKPQELPFVDYRPGVLKKACSDYSITQQDIGELWNGSTDLQNRSSAGRSSIRAVIDKFLSEFEQGNHFDFRSGSELVEIPDYADFITKKLKPLFETDLIVASKTHLLKFYGATLSRLSHQYGKLETHYSSLNRTVKEIERSIADEQFVKAIQKIEFQMVETEGELSKIKKSVSECCKLLESVNMEDQQEFFAYRPSNSEISTLFDRTQELSQHIERKRIERIGLDDIYDFQIRVRENETQHNWQSQLQHIGSEGTNALIKVIIYVAILSHFKSKAFKNADEIHLHCLVDEIGRLHSDYISELLKFCHSRGIYLAIASPETHRRPSDLKYTYKIERDESGKKVFIREVLAHDPNE